MISYSEINPYLTNILLFTTLVLSSPAPIASPKPILDDLLEGSLLSPVGAVLNLLPAREAPPSLRTKNTHPLCASLNRGALLCCETLFDGAFPLVLKLSQATGYELTPDAINGILCHRTQAGTCRRYELCCQVDSLGTPDLITIGLFCRRSPDFRA